MWSGGDVTGKSTIPTLTGVLTIGTASGGGDVNGGFVIDVLDGNLFIKGTLPSPEVGEIGDIISGSFEVGTVANGATLDLLNGMPLAAQQSCVDTLEGKLDLHNKAIRANLFMRDVTSTGRIVNGGAVFAIFYPAFNGEFADGATATFSSVAAGGSIYAFDSPALKDTNISGDRLRT